MTTTTTLIAPRRPRKAGPYFTQNDAQLLELLARFSFLQPRHLECLSGRFLHSIRRRLLHFHRLGYVDRLTLPYERERPTIAADQYVYRLSRRGIARAQALGYTDEHASFNYEKSLLFLEHEVLISDFHVALELATKAAGFQVVDWEQRRSQLLDFALDPHRKKEPVNPDALFGLRDLSAPPGANTRHFFLELVRSRESKYERGESYLLRKMRTYQHYAEQHRHTDAWGIKDFHVLVILPTPQRVDNLLAKLEVAELTFKRFWLTDGGRYSLETPAKILEAIFQTPRDFRSGSLYSIKD